MQIQLKNHPRESFTIVEISYDSLKLLPKLVDGYSKAALICDENTEKNCLPHVRKYLSERIEVITVPAGEKSKDLSHAKKVLLRFRQLGLDRKSLIIGLGGGVVNDLAGFAASVYMRGIDWVMLPTTLTAQADASIGGKTGVNLDRYKNMVGSFWPPKAVLIDPQFLATLPQRHLKNGLAEIIKMGFIYDQYILDHVERIDPKNILGQELNSASELAAKAKVEIVNADMYESGERKLLNFGHTIGHAVESLSLESSTPLLHGEAISIGMVIESRLAELEEVCEKGLSDKIANLLQKFNLPTTTDLPVENILKIISHDKKNVGSRINWTLPKQTGQGIYDHSAQADKVEKALIG